MRFSEGMIGRFLGSELVNAPPFDCGRLNLRHNACGPGEQYNTPFPHDGRLLTVAIPTAVRRNPTHRVPIRSSRLRRIYTDQPASGSISKSLKLSPSPWKNPRCRFRNDLSHFNKKAGKNPDMATSNNHRNDLEKR